MLTGEATAMTKTSMISSEKPFDVDGERLHVLYGGTKVLLTRIPNGMCKAIVLRTGFNTAKGAMVQSILFPKPINIKFESDGLKLGYPFIFPYKETLHCGHSFYSLLVSCQFLVYLDLYFQLL